MMNHHPMMPTPLPFITASQVVSKLNAVLADLEETSPEREAPPCSASSPERTSEHTTTLTTQKNRFELQRQGPDGSSTRRVTPSESAALDCQQKIQQAAAFVASLVTPTEQIAWAHQQRAQGNQLFRQQQYAEAIDIYLTCLPAVYILESGRRPGSGKAPSGEEVQADPSVGSVVDGPELDEVLLMYCQIMNNLAQSCLELHWYKRAIQFVTMALQHVEEVEFTRPGGLRPDIETPTTGGHHQEKGTREEWQLQTCKLFYKRGKAYRLRGEYQSAGLDLQRAMELCGRSGEQDDVDQRRITIERELFLLSHNLQAEKKNRQQQQRAMQSLLLASNIRKTTTNTTSLEKTTTSQRTQIESSATAAWPKQPSTPPTTSSPSRTLYPDDTSHPQPRTYSNLRAPRPVPPPQLVEEPTPPTTYGMWYLRLVGRVARQLLQWMEDADDHDDGPPPNASHSAKAKTT